MTFGGYRFQVDASVTETKRLLQIRAVRGNTLLTAFHLPIDRPVLDAHVADLDDNHFPEIYLFLSSDGSGSLGRVIGWQFLSQRKAEIKAEGWQLNDGSYMGHDSLWIEAGVLCRRFPVYRPGDANAQPSGGVRTIRYQLQAAGEQFILKPAGNE
ncbi:hypothetical protein BLX24_24120 [Arsenicibacter rosenii]|uniref:Uncharacterized protein n=1 Tax=Arsenicibacter rosenii TaxID=1750698 RepID=A0A1S2VCZ1_9BACT|nr:hypothetical protein BLX24_24120 [Arsenicibacter rosenii]